MEKVTVNGIDMCVRRAVLQVWKTGGVLKPDASPLITGCFAEAALSQTLKCRYDVKFCAKYREKEDITTLNCLEQRTTGLLREERNISALQRFTNESIFIQR